MHTNDGDGATPRLRSHVEARPDVRATPRTARAPIRVALIEDNRMVREGLTALLGRHPDFEVASADSDDYASVLPETGPAVALLDMGLGNGDSLEIARALHERHPHVRVILMDLLPAEEDIVDFIDAGVNGFILKDASLDQVILTIRSVAAGLDVVPDALASSLYSEIVREAVQTPGRVVDPDSTRLTPRERQVIALIADGMSNKAIARRLHISIHTVKSHLRNVMEKLTLHSRLQIANYVHEHLEPE